jgi:uroporphyrin-III C-methyltransferase
VLHDELVAAEILHLAPPQAQIYNVGKRCGNCHTSQEEINSLMVSLARRGIQVVRLKGGDPAIFGRLGEEAAALREADIEFEIVPGISAALGAASVAQVSLTHRRVAHSVTFVAGHLASASDNNWSALAASGATVVVYMPGREHGEVAERLIAAGFAADTPCAVISRATTKEEQVFRTTVGRLGEAPHLPAPALLMVGNVLQSADYAGQQDLQSAITSFGSDSPLTVPAEPQLS